MNSSDTARLQMDRVRTPALAVGAIGILVALIVGLVDSHEPGALGWQGFFRSYVFAYVFWIAIPLGSLALLMLHHCTGGWWGFPVRRIFEAGSRTIWFMAVLFIPILIGMSEGLSLDAAGRYCRRSRQSFQEDLFTARRLYRSRGNLFRHLDRAGALVEQVVRRAGPHRRSDFQGSHDEPWRRRAWCFGALR